MANAANYAPAQTLPYPLLCSIWSYSVCSNGSDTDNNEGSPAPHATFLSVCQTWRETARSAMYNDLFLNLTRGSGQVMQSIYRENKYTNVDERAVKQYTRDVHISIDVNRLFSKDAMQALVYTPVWGAISKSHICVSVAITRGDKADKVQNNIPKELERIIIDRFALFAATFTGPHQHLELRIAELSDFELSNPQRNLISSIANLLSASKLPLKALVADSYFVGSVGCSVFNGLCKLDLTLPNITDGAFALVHSNASTLKSLTVRIDEYTDFEPFVRDSKGQLIAYALLEELVVASSPEDQPTKRLAFVNEYTPFPKLRRVDFTQTVYPFGDDTLFRGNKATLESASMPLDNKLAGILAGTQRDGASAMLLEHTALYKFEINGNVDEVVADDDEEQVRTYAHAISANLLPRVTSVTVGDIDLSGIFLDVISKHTRFTRI
ncbi:hypothetical protein LPJ81_002343 [Coemansia sp. IMI 209127]|nr:hypothetical protein LPJ81_002343 [Coemansia sp. IMI 209127]